MSQKRRDFNNLGKQIKYIGREKNFSGDFHFWKKWNRSTMLSLHLVLLKTPRQIKI